MEHDNDNASTACHFDLGGGRRIDLEYEEDGDAWLAIGPGIQATDVWVKATPDLPTDIRVRIERQQGGIEVGFDQGSRDEQLWSRKNAPLVRIQMNPDQRSLTISMRLREIVQSSELKIKPQEE